MRGLAGQHDAQALAGTIDHAGFQRGMTERQAGQTGVWREGRKLASIGVHARDWVTWHGVALNIENDLATFGFVVPCGIDGVTMTTVERECRSSGVAYPGFSVVRDAVITAFAETFSLRVRLR